MSLTKLSLVGNYDVTYKLFLPRGSLVSDIPAGDGNIEKLFYGVREERRWERKGSAGDSRANEQVVGGEENRAARYIGEKRK